MNNDRLKARLYRICALILAAGLCGGALVYVAADEAPEIGLSYIVVDGVTYPVAPQYSKRYRRDLEQFGGKSAVLFDEFSRWFESLWQGKTLGLTLGSIGVTVSLGIFLFARWLPAGGGRRLKAAMANATDYLTQHAAERPHALAISTGRLLIHYGVLEQGVWRAAALLRNAGVAVGDVVGVALPDTPMYLIAVLALGRVGAVQTPLPMSDPAPLRQSYARRFGMKYVVAAAETGGVPGVRVIRMDRAALDSMQGRVSPGHRVDADDRVLAIWRTSGTTSEAKGVAITHRQWLAAEASRAQYYPRPLEDRFLNVLDMSLSFGLNMCQRALYNGGAVFLPPKPLGVKVMLDLVDSLAINRLAVTPNMLDALLPALPADQCRCPGIRDISVAGMIMPESLRREVRRRFSPGLIIRYGSNEARYVTHADEHTQEAYPETVGPAMHGVDLEIVDENDRPVARGEMGRVRARAPWMATGYYNAPELDAGTFRGGWVYLGDVGVLSAEGMLYIKGRVDDMMNCDGIKIMPADIEEVLLRHPAVAEAAAFPLRSQRHQDVPAAAVVLRQAVTVEALQDYCRKELGARAPTLVGVVKAMPRNAMGKVVRRTLAEQFVGKLQKKA